MGHQIEQRFSAGACQLTQCSCGRGALRIRNKVVLLSSLEVSEMSKIFSGLIRPDEEKTGLSEKLNQLTGHREWADFSLPEH
jgi:hypothetical protein